MCETTFVHRANVTSARKAIRDDETLHGLSEIFKTLGDPTRLKICLALGKEELCVCDIAALLSLTDSAVSHQLRMLKTMRLVKYRKDGKMVYYSLDDDLVEELIELGERHVNEA
jgi:ArsR family transcriptional regulator